jgi:ketosteroid isomerase-like protein
VAKENVQIVRRMYAVFGTRPIGVAPELLEEFIDPQIEWRGPREFPDLAEPHHGYEGVVRYGAKIAEVLDDYRMVPERFIDAGDDRVLVFSREGGRGKGSGAEVLSQLTAHLWTLKEGRAIRMQSYWERADALEAVGLTEQDVYADAS